MGRVVLSLHVVIGSIRWRGRKLLRWSGVLLMMVLHLRGRRRRRRWWGVVIVVWSWSSWRA